MLRYFAILLLTSALSAVCAQAEVLNVRLILSEDMPYYQQFHDALARALVEKNSNIAVVSFPAGEKRYFIDDPKVDLNIAIGEKAMELAISDFKAPLLNIMISRNAYETLREKRRLRRSSKVVSAIYIDQPWDRQFNFIRAALPNYNKVGILHSPDANIILPRLPRGMTVNTRPIRQSESLFSALESIMSSNDLMLVVPDDGNYINSNIRNITMTSFRLGVPMVGISQNHISAGMICAIFSTQNQIIEQITGTVISFAENRLLPDPQYPELFSIAVNYQAASSMGIAIDTQEIIRQRMDKAAEGKR